MTWNVRTNNFGISPLEGNIISTAKADLTKKAIKKLLMYWAIAIGCILIPVLHFVLVPSFIAVGIYNFRRTLGMKNHIVEARYTCPDCTEVQNIKEVYFNEDTRLTCNNCQVQMALINGTVNS